MCDRHMRCGVTETVFGLVVGGTLTYEVKDIRTGISIWVLHLLSTQVTYCVVMCKEGVYFLLSTCWLK